MEVVTAYRRTAPLIPQANTSLAPLQQVMRADEGQDHPTLGMVEQQDDLDRRGRTRSRGIRSHGSNSRSRSPGGRRRRLGSPRHFPRRSKSPCLSTAGVAHGTESYNEKYKRSEKRFRKELHQERSEQNRQEDCCICMDSVKECPLRDLRQCVGGCDMYFHTRCFQQYAAYKSPTGHSVPCPFCRKSIDKVEVVDLTGDDDDDDDMDGTTTLQ